MCVCVEVEPPIAGSVAIYALRTVHLFFMVPPWMLSSITCFFVEPVGYPELWPGRIRIRI